MNESKIFVFVTLICWWLANHYCLSDSCLLMIGKPNLNANKFSWRFVWIIESKQIVKICKGGQGGPDVSLEVWIVLCCDRILLTLLTPPTPNWGFLWGFWHHISFHSSIASFFRIGTSRSTDLRWILIVIKELGWGAPTYLSECEGPAVLSVHTTSS